MFVFDITKFVPKFILRDRNGLAIARAIEAGLAEMNGAVQDGVKRITDVESMPEWRLDELAWELNCLYDYAADVDSKRRWIREAGPLFKSYGTPKAIYNYLSGMFDRVLVEEAVEYGGNPFHFRVMLDGDKTEKNAAWAQRTIAAAKNVRSVLDDVAYVVRSGEAGFWPMAAAVSTEGALSATAQPPEHALKIESGGSVVYDSTGTGAFTLMSGNDAVFTSGLGNPLALFDGENIVAYFPEL